MTRTPISQLPPAHQLLRRAGLASTFWGKRIIAAEKRGYFTSDDILQSRNWTTCACGKQDQRIPRDVFNGAPKDADLRLYGGDFWYNVLNGRFRAAAERLIAIEKRACQVLASLPPATPSSSPSAPVVN